MNTRHRSEFYNHDDRDAAAIIEELCKDKPRKKMGPLDYSAGWNQPPSNAQVIKFVEKCAALLHERGAMTTVQLARELNSTVPTISAVMREIKAAKE